MFVDASTELVQRVVGAPSSLLTSAWTDAVGAAGLTVLPFVVLAAFVWMVVVHLRVRVEVAELRQQVTALRLDRGYLIQPEDDGREDLTYGHSEAA